MVRPYVSEEVLLDPEMRSSEVLDFERRLLVDRGFRTPHRAGDGVALRGLREVHAGMREEKLALGQPDEFKRLPG